MSNPIVRIALANLALAAIFGSLIAMEKPWFPTSASVLIGIAVLVNVVALLGLRRKTTVKPTEPPSSQVDHTPPVAQGPLGRVRAPTGAERRPPRPANRHTNEAPQGEMPPWLRMKGNIVMTWNGKHHVAPINGDDPFEVAQRLFEKLKRAEPEGQEPASEAAQTG
jgi:hypothetical protein